MKLFGILIPIFATLTAAAASPAFAGSATATLFVTIQVPLAIVFTPSAPIEACDTAPGTLVSALSVTGGDGNPITWSISGDTTDFALSGNNVVVGANGFAAADCGKVNTVVVTAAQS